MFTAKKYLKLLSCTDEAELDKLISKLSEDDAKSFVKTVIIFSKDTTLLYMTFNIIIINLENPLKQNSVTITEQKFTCSIRMVR